MTDFDDVGDFHQKFDLPRVHRYYWRGGATGGAGPRRVDDAILEFRIKFLHEELEEFEKGVKEEDHAQMFDALLDLVYVALGTAHFLGYPWPDGWTAVQYANMQKERALADDDTRSKRGSKWDVVKPEGWKPPDIKGILKRYKFPGV